MMVLIVKSDRVKGVVAVKLMNTMILYCSNNNNCDSDSVVVM